MLPEFSEVFTRIGSREVADSKRAGYSHVDRETTAMAPKRDRDITGATTRFIRITKDPLLPVKTQLCDPAIFKLLCSFVWVSQFWLKKSVVLCACKPSMFLATTPHAARRMLISFTATTASATCWERSAPKEHCLQFLIQGRGNSSRPMHQRARTGAVASVAAHAD